MKYYNIQKNNYNDNEKNIFVNFIVVNKFLSRCRRCRKTFSFNNDLHRHIRIDCEELSAHISEINDKQFAAAQIYSIKTFFINVTSESVISTFSIIRSIVDSSSNIDTKYDFRD